MVYKKLNRKVNWWYNLSVVKTQLVIVNPLHTHVDSRRKAVFIKVKKKNKIKSKISMPKFESAWKMHSNEYKYAYSWFLR